MSWKRRGGTDVLNRTVAEISEQFRTFLLTGRTTTLDGFLQKIHPKVKLVCVTALIVTTVASNDARTLLALFGFSLVLARLSKIPLKLHFSRFVFVLALSVVVITPQAFLFEGQPVVVVLGLTITESGVRYVLIFVLRVTTSVSFLSLMILTTDFTDIIAAIRSVGLSATMVSMMAITYRYLLLFFGELNRMTLAQRSRTFERVGVRESWRRLSHLLGTFFIRTIERGERVQLAAKSRGGTRSPRPYERSQEITKRDSVFAGTVMAIIMIRMVFAWLSL
jgi:cobalt/nickel transport system permease protein